MCFVLHIGLPGYIPPPLGLYLGCLLILELHLGQFQFFFVLYEQPLFEFSDGNVLLPVLLDVDDGFGLNLAFLDGELNLGLYDLSVAVLLFCNVTSPILLDGRGRIVSDSFSKVGLLLLIVAL